MTLGALRLPAALTATLDQLCPGTLHLRVPLLDGVIQVGTALRLPTATIEVRRTASSIRVRRTDGRPMQAHIVGRCPDGRETRSAVFAEPVGSLRLDRVRGSGDWIVWTPSGCRHPALVQLIETVLAFSVVKARSA